MRADTAVCLMPIHFTHVSRLKTPPIFFNIFFQFFFTYSINLFTFFSCWFIFLTSSFHAYFEWPDSAVTSVKGSQRGQGVQLG